MERKRHLFERTVNFVSGLWDRENRPISIKAEPINDVEDQVRFVVDGNEHQRMISEESKDTPPSSS